MSFWDDLFHNWSTWPNQVVNAFGSIFSTFGGDSAKAGWKQWVSDQIAKDQGSTSSGSLPAAIFDGITGKTNTDATNTATAEMQEDAQKFNAEQAEKQREFEHNEAEIARRWQEEMSNTAVQRQTADLKAAGLNPWLSAGGSGASTGSVGIAMGDSASSAHGQAINATKSGAEILAAVGITAASIYKILKLASK